MRYPRMSHIIKGVIWGFVMVGAGVVFLQTLTQSESDIKQKLQEKQALQMRQQNKELMAVLRRSAGFEDRTDK